MPWIECIFDSCPVLHPLNSLTMRALLSGNHRTLEDTSLSECLETLIIAYQNMMSVLEITIIKLSTHYDPDQNTKFRQKKHPSCYLHEEKRSKDEIGCTVECSID